MEYKETALGFCMKCMTLSKHWNDLCKLKRGLFAFLFFFFVSKHKLTIVFGFSNADRILYEIVDSRWCMVVVYFSNLFFNSCSTLHKYAFINNYLPYTESPVTAQPLFG